MTKPDRYGKFPHVRYRCPHCETTTVVIGWEIEAVRCSGCLSYMEWDEDMYHPNNE